MGRIINRSMTDAVCVSCARPFRVAVSEVKRGRGKTCTRSCAAKMAGPKDQRGDKNPNWKGGEAPAHRIHKRRYRAAHPERAAAHIAVRDAVAAGVLKPLPCETCGESRSEAHHDDYGRPLSVRWLCRLHHREHHYGPRQRPARSPHAIWMPAGQRAPLEAGPPHSLAAEKQSERHAAQPLPARDPALVPSRAK